MKSCEKNFVCVPKILQRKVWNAHLQGKTIKQQWYEYRIAEIDGVHYIECLNKDTGVWDVLDVVHPTAKRKHNYGWG